MPAPVDCLLVYGVWCVVDHEGCPVLLPACEVADQCIHQVLLHQTLGLNIHTIVPAVQPSWGGPVGMGSKTVMVTGGSWHIYDWRAGHSGSSRIPLSSTRGKHSTPRKEQSTGLKSTAASPGQ